MRRIAGKTTGFSGRWDFIRILCQGNTSIIDYFSHADPGHDDRFVKKVYINNFKLIDSLHKNQVFTYPMKDMDKTDSILTSLCLELRMNYRIILAPLGLKPFALICMLAGTRYPDIEVWRVGAGKPESVYDRLPEGEPNRIPGGIWP